MNLITLFMFVVFFACTTGIPSHPYLAAKKLFLDQEPGEGQCGLTLGMILKGVKGPVMLGEIIHMNMCEYCVCIEDGSFKCCLNVTNAARTFDLPDHDGRTCTHCRCGIAKEDIGDHARQLAISHNQIPEPNCYRNGLKMCLSTSCLHPVREQPTCIEAKRNSDGCCDHCVAEGCFAKWLPGVNTFKQISNMEGFDYQEEEIVKLGYGESVEKGCVSATCIRLPGGRYSELQLENICNEDEPDI
uniref:VWFC domain-containing protein n=1 Tax=Ciona savignyi TaxID=51511 RepID=H2ZGM1_CIOSA